MVLALQVRVSGLLLPGLVLNRLRPLLEHAFSSAQMTGDSMCLVWQMVGSFGSLMPALHSLPHRPFPTAVLSLAHKMVASTVLAKPLIMVVNTQFGEVEKYF